MDTQLIPVPGAVLEVADRGVGTPTVLVQTALTADELRPLAGAPQLAAAHRTIVYHRRGYGRSSRADGPGSVARDADDCRALLDALDIARAHVVGVSYSAAVGLQLAADAPDRPRSLVVLEPPPVHTRYAAQFRAATDRLLAVRRAQGPSAALDEFLTTLIGVDWRDTVERDLPGATAQMERDAATFFDTDVPALLDWHFGRADAGRITCPVLYVGGTDSGPWFAAVRELVLDWVPHADQVVVAGADHSLAITHASEIAAALGAFLRRHPV